MNKQQQPSISAFNNGRTAVIPLQSGAIMTEWCFKSTAFIRTHGTNSRKKIPYQMDTASNNLAPQAPKQQTANHARPSRLRITIDELLNPEQ